MTVRSLDGKHVERASVDTSYPDDLIELLLRIKGPAYVCDEISRDEDPNRVQRFLAEDIARFPLSRSRLERGRILDFGCGCGASIGALARMFPKAEIVGVELDPEFARAARGLAAHHGFGNVTIHSSPSGVDVPAGLGEFDAVFMCGVYEHLLPHERLVLIPKIWGGLKRGGFLFITETPHRYWFVEGHTTGIPLLNYLPDKLAHWATRLSPRYDRVESWDTLLRHGIRGASEGEVLATLSDASAKLVMPVAGDFIELWYARLSPKGRSLKKAFKSVLKGIKAVTGVSCVPFLCMVVERA